jgi:chemotaxis protein MotB
MGRKRASKAPAGAPLWMVTYGDLMSLLLTFFVLLVSFSSIQMSKFQKAMGSLRGALGVLVNPQSVIMLPRPVMPTLLNFPSEDVKDIYQEIVRLTGYMEEGKSVDVELTDQGIRITLGDPVLFDLGKADLRRDSAPVLEEIFRRLARIPCTIAIEGHTDDLPIRTEKFPSNWELSAHRALAVLHFAVDTAGIDPQIISSAGYGEFRPKAPNDSPENRAKNRRVEIRVNYLPQAARNAIITDERIGLVGPPVPYGIGYFQETVP